MKEMIIITSVCLFFSCSTPEKKQDQLPESDTAFSSSTGLGALDTASNQNSQGVVSEVRDYPIILSKPMNGQGVLVFKSITEGFPFEDTIKFLNADNTPFALLNYSDQFMKIEDEQYDLFSVANEDLSTNHDFSPRYFFPEYEIIHFDVLQKTNEYFELAVNDHGTIRKMLVVDPDKYKYYSWEDYILSAYILFDSKDNPLREAPNKNGNVVYEHNDYFFKGIEIKGEWIKVECNNDCKPCNERSPIGWIQWREGNKLLVQLGFVC